VRSGLTRGASEKRAAQPAVLAPRLASSDGKEEG